MQDPPMAIVTYHDYTQCPRGYSDYTQYPRGYGEWEFLIVQRADKYNIFHSIGTYPEALHAAQAEAYKTGSVNLIIVVLCIKMIAGE